MARRERFAMEDERFRKWFQPQHNVGVDPYTLKRMDREPSLTHIYEDGISQHLSPYTFFYVKWKKPSRKTNFRGSEMAWDDERFREWFQPQYNKDVDPRTLRKDDKEKRLIHHHENGVIQRTTCLSLFSKNTWHITSRKGRNLLMAWDDERFQEWFQPEYNPGIDPWKLHKYDRKTSLVHYNENGVVRRITCAALFTSKNWDTVKSRNSLAMEYREFREWYQPEYNAGIDPWSIKKSDDETPMNHVYEDGIIQHYTARQVFAQKAWLPKKFRNQLAIDNPTFKEWYQPEHNPDVNIKKLYRTDSKTKLIHVFEDGTVQKTTAFSLIYFNIWDEITREYKLAMEYP